MGSNIDISRINISLIPGDIIIARSRTILGSIISWVCNKCQNDPVYYTHAAMVFDSNNIIQIKSTIHLISFKDFFSTYGDFKIIRYPNLTDLQIEKMQKIGKNFIGVRYGYSRLIAQLFDQLFNTDFFSNHLFDKKDQICSSFIAYLYYIGTKLEINYVSWKASEPDDFDDEVLNHKRFEEVEI